MKYHAVLMRRLHFTSAVTCQVPVLLPTPCLCFFFSSSPFNLSTLTYPFFISLRWVRQCSAKNWRTYYSLTFEGSPFFSRLLQRCGATCSRLLLCSVCCVCREVASSWLVAKETVMTAFCVDLCMWMPTEWYAVLALNIQISPSWY
jgi:hypothetical protein